MNLLFFFLWPLFKGTQDQMVRGFIEFPQNFNSHIDYSQISVELLDEKLQLIDKTQCASKGLFLLPIYDTKKFMIRVVNSLDLQFGKFLHLS